jgi:hypothetical protein
VTDTIVVLLLTAIITITIDTKDDTIAIKESLRSGANTVGIGGNLTSRE